MTSTSKSQTLRRHALQISDIVEMRFAPDVTLQAIRIKDDSRIYEYESSCGSFWLGAIITNQHSGKCLCVLVAETKAAYHPATIEIAKAVRRRVFRRFLSSMRRKHFWTVRLQERATSTTQSGSVAA